MLVLKLILLTNKSYSIIVIKKKAKVSNNYLECLGNYKCCLDYFKNYYLFLNRDRLYYWLNKGLFIDIKIFKILRLIVY